MSTAIGDGISRGGSGGKETKEAAVNEPSNPQKGGMSAHAVDGSAAEPTPGPTDAKPIELVIYTSTRRQTMDGFGASDKWLRAQSTQLADLIWDKNSGIGLSLHRIGINPWGENGGSWLNARNAAARGARLWAAPWSPPANMKTGNSTRGDIGGSLKPEAYDAWATTLAEFAKKTKDQTGADLYAISIQNEPDFAILADYDGCVYDETQLVAFIKVLGPKLHAMNPSVKLLAPETSGWDRLSTFADAIRADADADALTDIFATHDYGYDVRTYADPGRPIWQTEVSHNIGTNDSMANGLEVATWIHDALTKGNASAWHFWWINQTNPADSSEGLLRDGVPTRRFYVLGNFSKFVRPGYARVDIAGITSDIKMIAFVGDGRLVIVAITDERSVTLSIRIDGQSFDALTPWTTSETADLVPGMDIISVGGRFTVRLESRTVTSLVSQ